MSLTASILATIAAQGASPSPEALLPRSKWTVRSEPADCFVTRDFGEVARPITWRMSRGLTGNGGQFALIVPRAGDLPDPTGTGQVTFAPSGEVLDVDWGVVSMVDGVRRYNIPAPDPLWTGLTNATTISFALDGQARATLPLEGVAEALTALRACGDALLVKWGADPKAIAPSPTEADIRDWSIISSYPADAAQERKQGHVKALVTVDRRGRAQACKVVLSSRSNSLDDATCRIALIRMRLAPAEVDGPASRYSMLSVRWMLP